MTKEHGRPDPKDTGGLPSTAARPEAERNKGDGPDPAHRRRSDSPVDTEDSVVPTVGGPQAGSGQ